ncbi:hypothetical protein [Plantactinospora soyae]|uniref:Uncharacterized protein n=1 Tax=Plantactinospora soyae TaxID=1544732 RepID=A0A927M1L6_9ACTN|nr:hypothetical protein [Plantactinospora soyae]MBE1486483.1 hypothetical protein [Plantactinospora soyae]
MTIVEDPLSGIDQVAWHRLHHAYGPATDVPDQLRALRTTDPTRRSEALSQLFGNVHHQGTRWQVSHVVVPFLVALVDDPATPNRAGVGQLLAAVAIGDRRDDELPFDPGRAFNAAERLTGVDTTGLIRRFYAGEDLSEEEIDLLEAEAVRWAADSYSSAAARLTTITGWLSDPDEEVAARAAALMPWFPATAATVFALGTASASRAQLRASANLALAHVPYVDPYVARRLRELSRSDADVVVVTAAIALAYREGASMPDEALSILVDASARDLDQGVVGWSRALRGFVMLALRRLGLG